MTGTKMGRPTKYHDGIPEMAEEYISSFVSEKRDPKFRVFEVVPSVTGLALFIGVSRETLYQWAKDEDKQEFSDTFNAVNMLQEVMSLNYGLAGKMSHHIVKLVLANHGYGERTVNDHTSTDGSMSPLSNVKVTVTEESIKQTLKELDI